MEKKVKQHKKLCEVNSQSLESNREGRRLRKQGLVGSMSSDCLSSISLTESMPKICLMKSINKNIQHLMQEEHELKPGHRPPTPARQSLPNLIPVGKHIAGDNTKSFDMKKSITTDIRKLARAGTPRSASPSFRKHQRNRSVDLDVNTEFWSGPNTAGSVVHLPPIDSQKEGDKRKDSRLTVAKKTLEKLDNVLTQDNQLLRINPHERMSIVHTKS